MRRFIIQCMLFLSISTYAQDRLLKVEPNHSTIGFNISIAGFSKVTGKFTDFEVLLNWNDTQSIITKLSSEINVSSINTGIPDRDTHLKSADFFNADVYPTISFVSDSIQKVGFSNFTIFGKLEMHGVKRDIELPLEVIKQDGNTIGFKLMTNLNRLDYGIGSEFSHTSMPEFLSNLIEVEIYFWTKKRKD